MRSGEPCASFDLLRGIAGATQPSLAAAVVHVEQGQPHGFVHQAGKGAAAAAERVRSMAVEFVQRHWPPDARP